MLKPAPLPSPNVAVLRSGATARWLTRPSVVLVPMIAVSTVIRVAVALQHQTPRYFPDEYIYASLGRSLAHGHFQIRGQLAHFPAILEPLLTAPLWRFFSTDTAYQLVQAQNALAASLAAVPIYALARWLGLARGYGYLCAAYGLVIPTLVLIPLNIADLIAYPLVLAAIAAGLRALDAPTSRRQVAFLAFATLATLARTQYFVLVPAYIAAAVILERRRVFRRHKVATLALVPVAAAIAIAALGFYSGVRSTTHLNGQFIHWFLLQAFLLAVETGVAIVPGAVIAFARPAERRGTVFSLFAGTFTVLLFCESAVYAANSNHFKERYLFTVLPLIAVAYGVYLKRGRPHRFAVLPLVAVIAVLVSRLPISAYAISTLRSDSQFLYGVSWVEARMGYGSAALMVALLATAGGALALWTAYKRDRGLAIGAAIVVAVAASLGAAKVDLHDTKNARTLLPGNLSWVDAATSKPVTAVATPLSSRAFLFLALYWNTSITREVALDHAVPTDGFSAPDLRIGPDGRLLNTSGNILFDRSAASASFWNASVIAQATGLTLWHARGVPQLRTLLVGRYSDDWLTASARIRAWPNRTSSGRRGTAVTFTLSLPADWKESVHLKLGRNPFVITPGMKRSVVCWNSAEPLDVVYSSRDLLFDQANRPLTAQLTKLDAAAVPAGRAGSGCDTTGLLTRRAGTARTAIAAARVQRRAPHPVL